MWTGEEETELMLTHALSLIVVTLTPQGDSAKELIQKMLARYHAAQTLTGTIKLTVKTEAGAASMDTWIQYERPSKLYIRQKKNSANPDPEAPSSWLITSDGKI